MKFNTKSIFMIIFCIFSHHLCIHGWKYVCVCVYDKEQRTKFDLFIFIYWKMIMLFILLMAPRQLMITVNLSESFERLTWHKAMYAHAQRRINTMNGCFAVVVSGLCYSWRWWLCFWPRQQLATFCTSVYELEYDKKALNKEQSTHLRYNKHWR
jgi:hypothetical protein